MTFSNYSCHVTPLISYIYRFELAKFMHKLHHGALPKICDKFFRNISSVHSYKTKYADNDNYFVNREKFISFRGSVLWTEIKQADNFAPCHLLQTL